MFLAASNKPKKLLCISYADLVNPEQVARGHADVAALLAGLGPDFRLLVNLSQLQRMDIECMQEIGVLMETIDRAGVSKIVRIVPDSTKDIGLNIMTLFHYQNRPDVVTCTTMTEAAKHLDL